MDRYPTAKTIEEFKKAAREQEADAAAECLLKKTFVSKVEDGEEDRTLRFTISTADVDRDDDTIDVNGWKLDNFRRSGTVLWAHNHKMPPIAKPTKTWVEEGALKSIAEFAGPDLGDHDHLRFSNMIFMMYKKGFMRGTSVGFKPLKFAFNEERGGMAVDFIEQELLEYSAAPVPSNASALYEARQAGIDLDPLAWWAERSLDEGNFDVPEDELNLIRKIATGDRSVVAVRLDSGDLFHIVTPTKQIEELKDPPAEEPEKPETPPADDKGDEDMNEKQAKEILDRLDAINKRLDDIEKKNDEPEVRPPETDEDDFDLSKLDADELREVMLEGIREGFRRVD